MFKFYSLLLLLQNVSNKINRAMIADFDWQINKSIQNYLNFKIKGFNK